MELIVKNTDEEILNYKIGQEVVKFTCDGCGNKKLIKICDIESDKALCSFCQKSTGTIHT